MKSNTIISLAAISAFSVSPICAAVIDIPTYSQPGLGSSDNTLNETPYDIATANGGNVLKNDATPESAYFVTVFDFGTDSLTHMRAHFIASLNFQQDRLGVEVQDNGLVTVFGGGPLQTNSSFTIGGSTATGKLAGQRVIILGELLYDQARNTNDNDTLMNMWVNPDNSDSNSPGSGTADIFNHVWNSSNFPGFLQGIQNQNTPTTAGSSSMFTRIFTNDGTNNDANFASALAYATTIPEPSAAILGALGALALLRRRR